MELKEEQWVSVCLILLRNTTSTFNCIKTRSLFSSLTFTELYATTFPSATSREQLVIESLFLGFFVSHSLSTLALSQPNYGLKQGNLLSTSLTSELSSDQELGAGASLLPTRSYVLLASRQFEGQPASNADSNVMRFHSAHQTFGLAGLADILKHIWDGELISPLKGITKAWTTAPSNTIFFG